MPCYNKDMRIMHNRKSDFWDYFQVVLDAISLIFKILVSFIRSFIYFCLPIPEKSVTGEVILVTGAARGIGKEIALQYAELGAIVVCVDINEKLNNETVQMIRSRVGSEVYGFKCDVSNYNEVFEVVKHIKLTTKRCITVLVNNAGVVPAHSFLEHNPAEIEKVFQINIIAHIWLLQAILPDMLSNKHGHIVAVSSISAIIHSVNLVPYGSTKSAVAGLMRGLDEELKLYGKSEGIHFTCVYPSIVMTDLPINVSMRFYRTLSIPLSPKYAASVIISSMRKNKFEVTIPFWRMNVLNIFRLLPRDVIIGITDFMQERVLSTETSRIAEEEKPTELLEGNGGIY